MTKVQQIAVPADSLLAQFAPSPGSSAANYRDCFVREVREDVAFEEFVTRFYSSWAFTPERIALSLIDRGASTEDARKLAYGEADSFAAWNVVERRSANGLVAEHGPAGSASPTGCPQARKGRGDRTPDGARTTQNAEILLQDFSGATASWLSVEALEGGTKLYFGSWVRRADSPLVKALMPFHRWYSRVLLGGV